MTGRGVGSGALLASFFRAEKEKRAKPTGISDSFSLRIGVPSLRMIASPWILERASRFFLEDVRIGMNRANLAKRFFCAIEYLKGEIAILEIALRSAHREGLLANVKDEPRRDLA